MCEMTSMARSSEQYYDKISLIQRSMHEREKRRQELEKEMFHCSSSQIKCSKLLSYLKDICEREARAKMRNLKLVRDVECLERGMKEYNSDTGPLQRQKAEFLKKICNLEARRKTQEEVDTAKVHVAHNHYQDFSRSRRPKDLTLEPAIVFTGRQTSRGSDAEAGTTSVHSHPALHHSPSRSVHSHGRLPSGLLKDFRVNGENATSNQAHLSVDISGSGNSPDSLNLSDKHERIMVKLPLVRASTDIAGNVPFASAQEPSPLVTLTGHVKNLSLSSSHSFLAELTDTSEVVHQPPAREDGESAFSHLIPHTTSGKEVCDTPGICEHVKSRVSDVDLSENNAPPGGTDDHTLHSQVSSLHSNGSSNISHINSDSSPPVTLERLPQEGLFYLLDNIEGRLHCERTGVYGDSSIDGQRLSRVISLCNSGAGMNDEDLEACGAVVLHELQGLSWSTAHGAILSEDVVRAHQSSTDPNEISASLAPDAARLWDRWFKHALLLKEHRVLSTERLVQLFTPLLLERDATYSHQAKVLLRTLVSRSSEEYPSEDQSDLSSSCGSPSPLDDKDLKPVRLEQTKHMQELQSSEEDSEDESPVESVPIRESKAYQLLKQSVMQTRLQTCEEEDADDDSFSGTSHDGEGDLGRAKCSSHQDPYPRHDKAVSTRLPTVRRRARSISVPLALGCSTPSSPAESTHMKGNITSKALSALQSKGFWSDSDECNSDIEAALRPQPFNTNTDDFDDFCD